MSVPQITLEGTLTSILDAAELYNAAVIVTLCGFGTTLPCVVGDTMIADAGIPQKVYTTSTGEYSITLWGNDVISPAGTFYCISIVDAQGNVVQSNNYSFSGTDQLLDISNLNPLINPGQSLPSNYVTVTPGATVQFASYGWSGPITFDLTLTENVTASSFAGIGPGQLVQFIIQQNATGSWTFTWPANVLNPPVVSPGANATTTALFVMRNNGILYPVLAWS